MSRSNTGSANRTLTLLLAGLLGATVYGLVRTRGGSTGDSGYGSGAATVFDQSVQVDQKPLLTAQSLAQLPTSADELPFAKQALQVADQEMDLAFATALLDATEHPPALSAEAKQIQARLQRAEDGLASTQSQVNELTVEDSKASATQKDALDNRLELAKATLELRQDQVDDAKQDLIRAGGDPEDRIQTMVQEHQTASQSSDSTKINSSEAVDSRGLIPRFNEWWALHQKQLQLWRAKQDAVTSAATLSAQHESLESQAGAREQQAAASAPAENAAKPAGSATVPVPTEDTAAELAATKQNSANRRMLASLDKRVSNEQQLANIYGQWIGVVAAEQRLQINRALIGLLIILIIGTIALFVDDWIERLLQKLSTDRRQLETMRATTRLTLQVIALLFVLLVIFGRPTQLGTFLGLASAGLTIALAAFPVAFMGWLVLMGKGGIRIGDWVEINGVMGEVIELGIFQTVLLETGNWAESGHPTGRRVTFTNTYAIQGYYFNFSTSGQWMWDELQIVIPDSQDPYPVAKALEKKVTEATAEVVKQAEEEWRRASKSRDMRSLSAEPSVRFKPVAGGTAISIRYVTSAHQRADLRAKLEQAAVDLLGPGHVTSSSAEPPAAAVTSK